MKRISALILSAVMLAAPALTAYADKAVDGTCGENLTWNFDAGSTLHIKGSGDMDDYEFGKAPFFNLYDETKFLSVADGVTSIGDAAFRGFSKLTDTYISKDVRRIGSYAFSICHSLTRITLPSSLEEIDGYAFSHCSRLESVSIPEGVRELKEGTFEHNYALKTVDIPATMESIDLSAFEKCDALEAINVAADNPVYSSVGGALYKKDGTTLIFSPNGMKSASVPSSVKAIPDNAYLNNYSMASFDVPEGVTSIGDYAFGNCLQLRTLTLHEGLERVGECAFMDCGITHIKLPSTLQTFGRGAFWSCGNLVEIDIPHGTKALPGNLFTNCVHLEKIILPDTITSIGSDVFLNCDAAEIYYRGSEEQWSSLVGSRKIADRNITVHFDYEDMKSAEVTEDTIRVIIDGEYLQTDTHPIIINDRTLVPLRVIFETLGFIVRWDDETKTANAYDSAYNTEPEISITIGEYEFYGNYRTRTLDVPAQIVNSRTMVPLRAIAESLGRSVAWDAKARTVTISNGVAKGECGFNASWTLSDDGTLTITGSGEMYDDVSLWGDDINRIKMVIIGEGITRIGGRAFQDCHNLDSIEFPSTLTEIGNHAFWECAFEEIVIPKSVTVIQQAAFAYCPKLKKAVILGDVTSLLNVFSGCDELEEVTLPDTIEKLSETFWHCDSLKKVNLPSSLKSIGWVAFCGCYSLERVTVPENVTYIGSSAFAYCKSLSEVILPEGLEEIDKGAFKACESLKEIVIPKTVTKMGKGVFLEDWGINVIYEDGDV